jgi:O-methyltransferase domain
VDFFRRVPSGGDAYILKWIVHDWNDEQCVAILRNCRKAASPASKLLTVEAVLPGRNEPSFCKLMDLNMLVMTGDASAPNGVPRQVGSSRRPAGAGDSDAGCLLVA